METKYRYIQFPLFLLQKLLINKEPTINNILNYGLCSYADKISYKIEDVARQALFDYYRGNAYGDLKKQINDLIEKGIIEPDEDYNGFSGANFTPEEQQPQLVKAFESDERLKEYAILNYQVHMSAISQNIIMPDKQHSYIEYLQLKEKTPDKEPMPMVKTDLLFEFRDNNKSLSDLIQFAAYIGAKSILGKSQYCKTNNDHFLARMFGFSHKHVINFSDPDIEAIYLKYAKRYHIGRLKESLELNWNLITYSYHTRGYYLGDKKKINIDSLALVAERKKQKTRTAKLTEEKMQARLKALQHLNKEQQLNKGNNA